MPPSESRFSDPEVADSDKEATDDEVSVSSLESSTSRKDVAKAISEPPTGKKKLKRRRISPSRDTDAEPVVSSSAGESIIAVAKKKKRRASVELRAPLPPGKKVLTPEQAKYIESAQAAVTAKASAIAMNVSPEELERKTQVNLAIEAQWGQLNDTIE